MINPNNGPVQVVPQAEGLAHIRERINSSEWWVLLVASPQSTRLCVAIETRFFSGERTHFFEVAMMATPVGAFGVAMAKKTYLLPAELERLTGVPLDGTRDVIACPDTSPAVLEWFVNALSWRPAA